MALRIEGTRVTVCLPVNTPTETSAAGDVVRMLVRRYRGATASLLNAPVFVGSWEDGDGNVVLDNVALVIVDVRDRGLDDDTFLAELGELKGFVFERYGDAGSPQAEVWLIASPISILIG